MAATRAQMEAVMSVSARMIECGCGELAGELLKAFSEPKGEAPAEPDSLEGKSEDGNVDKVAAKRQADRDRLRQKRHVARLSQGVARVSQGVVADLSHATSGALAPASEPLSIPLSAENSSSPSEKNSEKRERNARDTRDTRDMSQKSRATVALSQTVVASDNGYDKTPPTPLWIKLYKIWEEVVHNGMPSGSPSTYQRDLEPLATGLLARRPKDPEGLFREVLIKYVAAKRKADKKPALNFFCRDFAGEADYRERERDNAPPPSSWVNPEADAQMRRDLNGGSQAYEPPPALDALIAKVGKRVPA